jgi:hypothetical protein
VQDALEGEVADAVFADSVLAKERSRKARKAEVVQGHDDGAMMGTRPKHGRRKRRKEVMDVHDFRPHCLDQLFDPAYRPL